MQIPTVSISQIDNGYLVTVYAGAGQTGTPVGAPTSQFCADKNAVAAYLITTLLPGAAFTPAPTPTATVS